MEGRGFEPDLSPKGAETMTTVTLEQAQASLPELIEALVPGDELLITKDQHPIARLVAEPRKPREPRKPGGAVGILRIIKEDDAHLEDFREYMP